ncbi:hypothetical protein B0H14DRAFT_3443208 [Mycena olivaceomarginata]|nr:hypothetical protein B0H14DRAFT_3443208 [Mycena olivaceomarginata]
MFHDGTADDPPVPSLPDIPRPRKAIFSDKTLYEWKKTSCDRYVLEFLRMDGCGDASDKLCPGCLNPARRPAYRCRECQGGILYCKECCVARHLEHPLHIVDAWNGSRFLRTSLKALGQRVQFGHLPGQRCGNPEPARSGFVVLHHNSIHEVAVDFCGPGCENRARAGQHDTQLLRGGWFPASEDRPQTCMTLTALEHFHIATLQAKTMMYDYYNSLEKLTQLDGTTPPDRYQVFIQICRKHRHTLMLKRGGRGHNPGGAEATKPGELAVRCPACPRPGINLPQGWEKASKEDRFIYTLFLALDACFRLKRGLVSSELKDPGLGTGLAYLLENIPYREYLLTVTDQKEMSTCSGLAALDYANTKFSADTVRPVWGWGFAPVTSSFSLTVLEIFRKGSDYIFASILRHHDPLLRMIISYDIVCQWWKQLFQWLLLLPELVRFILVLPWIAFVIPKMHIHAHTLLCGILYSLNLIPGSGQTDGEGIERPWANIGGIVSSTRIMDPGARHNTIDDHWGFCNWVKLISLAKTLRRRLDAALEQQVIQQEALDEFSSQQQGRIESWKKMVHNYENDSKAKNPYEAVVVGVTEMEVRLQFQWEEEEAAKKGLPAKHKITPSAFMTECLEIEDEQCEVRMQAELKKSRTATQEVDMSALCTKLLRRLQRLRKLQGTYSPASIMALENRDAPANEQAEDEPLFLPSALSEAEHGNGGCTPGLYEMELLMHEAYLHARGQGSTTRARSIVARNELKIRLHSEKYQMAWAVLMAASGNAGEVRVGWKKLRKEDIRCMEDADDLKRKQEKRKKAKTRRKRKLNELLSHGVDVPAWAQEGSDDEDDNQVETQTEGRGKGESRREVSWIWTAAGSTGTDAAFEDALRIEWAKVYARSQRWNEEVRLLKEEFRRLPISLEWQGVLWAERAKAVSAATGPQEEVYAQGKVAYGLKQEALFLGLAARARETEMAPKLGRGKRGPRDLIVDPLAQATWTNYGKGDGEDDGDDDAVLMAAADEADADNERGELESDEEVIMGGEVDDV